MASATSSNSPRRPWMATAIWGWRLEIVLTLGTFFVLALAARIVAFGPLLVILAGLVALQMRPDVRNRLQHHVRTNRDHRWLQAAFWHCAIIGRDGRTPKVIRSATLPVGRRYLLQLPVGLYGPRVTSRHLCARVALGADLSRCR